MYDFRVLTVSATTPPPPAIAAAGALTHPSRRRIARLLSDSPTGLTVSELADAVGLHRNAVRQHLQALAEAGVAAAARDQPSGRGRPGLRYRIVNPEVTRIAAHQELVALLVRLLVRVDAGEPEVERFGREEGGAFTEAGGADALVEGFARLAFAPRETSSATDRLAGRLEVSLEHCPFREAVSAPGGELVCVLHRGIAQGMADTAWPGARVTAFSAEDPARAGCRVAFGGLPAAGGGEDAR